MHPPDIILHPPGIISWKIQLMDYLKALITRNINPAQVIKESQKIIAMSYRVNSRKPKLISYSSPPMLSVLHHPGGVQRTAHSTSTSVYQSHIGGEWRNITVVWCKNLMNHSLTVAVDSVDSDSHQACKIDLKPWYFWAKKGYKTFEVDGNQLHLYWDLRTAKYSGSSEPFSGFYVALVCDDEMVLLLGDYNSKAHKITKSRQALVEATLFYKKDHVFNKKSFATRAKFDWRHKEHDIVVESSTSGPKDPEMWVSVDGIVLIHIRNLQWKFRGNQTVSVNKLPVQIYWDVHSWLFGRPGSGPGLFIFKPGQLESDSDKDESSVASDSDDASSSNSRYYSVQSHSKAAEFCLFLNAWKI